MRGSWSCSNEGMVPVLGAAVPARMGGSARCEGTLFPLSGDAVPGVTRDYSRCNGEQVLPL